MVEKEPELLKMPKPGKQFQPIGGFWMRTTAILLDLIFLHFFLYAFVFLAKEYLFKIGSNSVFIGLAVILAYFVLLDGPLGKGKTLGKALLNIAVNNYEAQPLEFFSALRRTLICLNVFILSVFLGLVYKEINSTLQMFTLNLFSAFIWGFLIANGILIGVHPLKQGIHDLVTRSFVAKVHFMAPYKTFKEKLPEFQRWQSSAFQSATIGFIAMMVLASVLNYKATFSKSEHERLKRIKEVRERFKVSGFELVEFNYGFLPSAKLTSPTDKPTTPMLSTSALPLPPTGSEELKYAVIFFYRTYHSFDEEKIKNSADIKNVMQAAGKWVKENLPELAPTVRNKSVQKKLPLKKPEKIYFIFEKRINQTFLYQYAEETRLEINI